MRTKMTMLEWRWRCWNEDNDEKNNNDENDDDNGDDDNDQDDNDDNENLWNGYNVFRL